VYNAGRFISRTIDSILEQDYENLQLVIADDCSSDGTVDIVKGYATKYPDKIKLILNNYNLGITDNCNQILQHCTGKYIAFFAGDDLMYPGKVSAQVKVMEECDDCSFTYHSVDVLDGDKMNEIIFTTEVDKQGYLSFLDIISKGGVIGACSIMVRSSCLPPGGFSRSFPRVSDWLMHIEVALRGRVIKVPGVYGGYLRHRSGESRKTNQTLDEIKGTLSFLADRYNGDHSIQLALRKSFRRYMLGEVARLFISGDRAGIIDLSKQYCSDSFALKSACWITAIGVSLGLHKIDLVRGFYTTVSVATKK
jgi:glycosyltransferase involved in cell wall biosynthesis